MAGFTPSPELYPFESRWFDASAGRMHYVDEGTGRPLLMVHGNPSWSFIYRNLIRGLSDSFRCVAVDMLGFGLSERPPGFGYTAAEQATALGELFRRLDLRGAIVMGHDWGGPIGLRAAADHAEHVHGLVLGNTWFWPPDTSKRTFSKVMSSPPLQWAILRRNFFVEQIMPMATARKLTDEEMEHYRAVQPTPGDRRGVAEFPRQIVAAGPWLGRLSQDVPRALGHKRVLITWPMRDPAFSAGSDLPRVRSAFSDVEVVELPGARHYFQEDAPGEVVAAIRSRFASP